MMSPLSFLVMLLIMIIIPTILYSFFFLMTCPTNPFNLFRRRPNVGSKSGDETDGHDDDECKKSKELTIVVSSKLPKDTECPVCLAAFVEGEEVKQLNICKHIFHKTCIDKWLSAHFNCPVCRAFVVGNHSSKDKERSRVLVRDHAVARDDLWQGLPGAAGLV